MALFNEGKFISHSGKELNWKIDCDALTDDDIKTLARLVIRNIGPFSEVIGIPKGGTRLANALKSYIATTGPTLIVDDVLTTGQSMEEAKKLVKIKPAIGVVIFARRATPRWVIPIFDLHMYL